MKYLNKKAKLINLPHQCCGEYRQIEQWVVTIIENGVGYHTRRGLGSL